MGRGGSPFAPLLFLATGLLALAGNDEVLLTPSKQSQAMKSDSHLKTATAISLAGSIPEKAIMLFVIPNTALLRSGS